jgi:hypothetical protein
MYMNFPKKYGIIAYSIQQESIVKVGLAPLTPYPNLESLINHAF